jgi:hypothetical protein
MIQKSKFKNRSLRRSIQPAPDLSLSFRAKQGISLCVPPHCRGMNQSKIPRGVYPERPERDPWLRSG